MESPRYTVIVPMTCYRADEPVLRSLRETVPPAGGVQIIVATGAHPARQRNLAVMRAQGEIVVFLDNDCTLGPRFWDELAAAFARPEVEIVGGPARLRDGASGWEKIFHALLSHRLIVGGISARYFPRGEFRPATQTDLILCNLSVRRATFGRIGPLASDLYPNEENEWLDRAQVLGVGTYYDPALQIFRPQRATPAALFLALLRYGMGRTRQFRVSGWRVTFHQFLPLIFLGVLTAVALYQLEVYAIAFCFLLALVVSVTLGKGLVPAQRLVAGVLSPAIPLCYVLGQCLGWLTLMVFRPAEQTASALLDGHGNPL